MATCAYAGETATPLPSSSPVAYSVVEKVSRSGDQGILELLRHHVEVLERDGKASSACSSEASEANALRPGRREVRSAAPEAEPARRVEVERGAGGGGARLATAGAGASRAGVTDAAGGVAGA